jgi:small redox-active disulfide protein 2
MDIKVLGTGCANCRKTIAEIELVAKARGVAVNIGKVEEIKDIIAWGVMSTPGVVIDGKVVHAGGVPTRDKIEQWLAAPAPAATAVADGGCCGGAQNPKCCG